jgi:hypothetical protein
MLTARLFSIPAMSLLLAGRVQAQAPGSANQANQVLAQTMSFQGAAKSTKETE